MSNDPRLRGLASWRVRLSLALATGCGLLGLARAEPWAAFTSSVGDEDAATCHRVECFELRAGQSPTVVGYASLHRSDGPDGSLLEWQIHFPADDVSVWHAENRAATEHRWTWRERRTRASRAVAADDRGDALAVTEWGRPTVWRTTLSAPGDAHFPLELQERLRADLPVDSHALLFDPLSNDLDAVEVVRCDAPVESGEERRFELRRTDGSSAGRWSFQGAELIGFEWQAGGLRGQRIDAEGYSTGLARARAQVRSAAAAAELENAANPPRVITPRPPTLRTGTSRPR